MLFNQLIIKYHLKHFTTNDYPQSQRLPFWNASYYLLLETLSNSSKALKNTYHYLPATLIVDPNHQFTFVKSHITVPINKKAPGHKFVDQVDISDIQYFNRYSPYLSKTNCLGAAYQQLSNHNFPHWQMHEYGVDGAYSSAPFIRNENDFWMLIILMHVNDALPLKTIDSTTVSQLANDFRHRWQQAPTQATAEQMAQILTKLENKLAKQTVSN